MGLLEANQEDRVSLIKDTDERDCVGLALWHYALPSSYFFTLLSLRSLPFHPYPYTILSLETLYYLSSTPNQIRDCEYCGGGSRSSSPYSSPEYHRI